MTAKERGKLKAGLPMYVLAIIHQCDVAESYTNDSDITSSRRESRCGGYESGTCWLW